MINVLSYFIIMRVIFFLLLSLNGFSNVELAKTYINKYKGIAVSEMKRTGIPASIKLAQGLLESDWGRSRLASDAYNHFGIKCGSKWEGETFYKHDDDFDKNGKLIKSCFRAFKDPYESYIAHSEFLNDPNKEYRYGFLFDLKPDDYRSWAKGLKKAGYATDRKYPQKLIKIIEQYQLYQFDEIAIDQINSTNELMVQNSNVTPKVKDINHDSPLLGESPSLEKEMYHKVEANSVTRVLTKGGEVASTLARICGISPKQIIKYNEEIRSPDQVLSPDTWVYIQAKPKTHYGEASQHKVQKGQTMFDISQEYGIDLKSLYRKNRIPYGSYPKTGETINLKHMIKYKDRPQFSKTKTSDSEEEEYLFDETWTDKP